MVFIVKGVTMGRGRKPIHQTDEDRERAIRESKMKYYKKNKADILKKSKDRYHKNKVVDTNDGLGKEEWDEDHALDQVMNDMVDDVTFEPFDDDTSGDYEGIIT